MQMLRRSLQYVLNSDKCMNVCKWVFCKMHMCTRQCCIRVTGTSRLLCKVARSGNLQIVQTDNASRLALQCNNPSTENRGPAFQQISGPFRQRCCFGMDTLLNVICFTKNGIFLNLQSQRCKIVSQVHCPRKLEPIRQQHSLYQEHAYKCTSADQQAKAGTCQWLM